MSMVERLAKRSGDALYAQLGGFSNHEEAHKENARWWLNAVADEIDAEGERRGRAWEYEWHYTADHLRNQAKEENDDPR